jgi:DNA-binding response OmpR family regulator
VAKILIAEADGKTRRLIGATLADLGHDLAEATTARAAIEAVREQRPDLIVLDVATPGMGGWDFVRELRRVGGPAARILMLTARSSESDFVHGWRLGVDEFMTKPFDPEELAIAVNETLMMTPEQIREKRRRELEKAQLLSRIEAAFED